MPRKPTRTEAARVLTEIESKEMVRQAGISVNETILAKSEAEAVFLARRVGFPVAIKVASPEIVHKSDAGGVRLGLHNEAEVATAYREIMAAARTKFPGARIDGVSVQKMAPPGLEVIIGANRDAQFGPVVMFGLGGITVEVYKDVSLRVVPLRRRDAAGMIKEIKGYPLLTGFRGREPVDIKSLEDMLLKVSRFIAKHPEIKELDLNPVIAYRDGALAVDARIVID